LVDLIANIDRAAGWNEYYAAFQSLYREVVESRWCLGKAAFAHQLHHTAIPDSSGATLNAAHWAAYSQPSNETLDAFLRVFAQLLNAEPHRVRTNRYFFLVPTTLTLTREQVSSALEPASSKLDYWLGSLSEELDHESFVGPLRAVNVMFSTNQLVLSAVTSGSPQSIVADAARQVSAMDFRGLSSTVEPSLRKLYAMSSVLLAATRTSLSAAEIAEFFGDATGVAAFIAGDRAKSSRWSEEHTAKVAAVLSIRPPQVDLYKVQPGDILTRIIRQRYEQSFHALWPILRSLNPHITDPNFIRAGEVLRLPRLGAVREG